MSIYEDPRAVDQLADEAVMDDEEHKAFIKFTHEAINALPNHQLKFVLNCMMKVITKTY